MAPCVSFQVLLLSILQGKCQRYRRRRRASSFRPVEDITEEDLENVAITVRDKIYDKVLVNDTLLTICVLVILTRVSKALLFEILHRFKTMRSCLHEELEAGFHLQGQG